MIVYAFSSIGSNPSRDRSLDKGAVYVGMSLKGQHQGFGRLEASEGTYVGSWKEGLR